MYRKALTVGVKLISKIFLYLPENRWAINKKAQRLLKENKVKEAEFLYQKLQLKYPNYAAGYEGYAWAAQKNKNWQEVLARWSIVLDKFPENIQAYLELGQYHNRFGKTEDAKATYYKGIKNIKESDSPNYVRLKINYIQSLIRFGDLEKAYELVFNIADNPHYTKLPIFYSFCCNSIENKNNKRWRQLNAKLLSANFNTSFFLEYVLILQDNHLIDQAINFVSYVQEQTKKEKPIFHLLALLEELKLKSIQILGNSKNNELIIAQSNSLEEHSFKKIMNYINESTSSLIKDWFISYQQSQQLCRDINPNSIFSTRSIPLNTLKIAKVIIDNIKEKTPFSLIRLGDENLDKLSKLFKDPKTQFNEDSKDVSKLLSETFKKADIIGVFGYEGLYNFPNVDEEFLRLQSGNTQDKLAINNYVLNVKRNEVGRDYMITSSTIHQELELWGLYDLIFSYINSCSIITNKNIFEEVLEKRFSLSVRQTISIKENDSNLSESLFKEIALSVSKSCSSEVYLVDAGIMGKICCNIIKKAGGIAIDIGDVLASWMTKENKSNVAVNSHKLNRLSLFYNVYPKNDGLIKFYETIAQKSNMETYKPIPHYWINMERDVKRRTLMEVQFANLKLPNTRINAVTPLTLPKIKKGKAVCSLAEYSCLMSHFKAMQVGIDRGDEIFVIQEDDVIFPDYINLPKIIKAGPRDWEILQIHTSIATAIQSGIMANQRGDNWVAWNRNNCSTGLYIIRRKAAEKLLTKFSGNIIDLSSYNEVKPVADYLIYKEVKTYTITFPLIYTFNEYSNINNSDLLWLRESTDYIKKNHLQNYKGISTDLR